MPAAFLLVLIGVADTCPISCGRNHALVKQELQLLVSIKYYEEILIHESSMSLLVQPIL